MEMIGIQKRNLILLISFLVLVPFFAYLFVPFLNNPDTYYFFFASCGNGSISDQPFLAQLFFGLIPCSEFLYKLIPFVLLFASTLIVWKTSQLLYKKYAFIAPIALFLTPAWVLMYSKFENDTFAYFTLILTLYFFVKTKAENFESQYWANVLLTILFLVISGLFWTGSFYFLIGLATASIPILIFGSISILVGIVNPMLIFDNLLSFLVFTDVTENAPIIGFIILFWLLFTLVKLNNKLKWPTITFVIISLFNVKLGWFAVPLLALSFPNLIDYIKEKKGEQMSKKFVQFFIIGAIITTIVSATIIIIHPFPTYEMMDGANDLVELSNKENLPIFNDWQYGYFIKYFGGTPSNIGQPADFIYSKNSVVLTIKTPEKMEGCKEIKNYYETIDNNFMRLWYC
jgi:hypothetical protein